MARLLLAKPVAEKVLSQVQERTKKFILDHCRKPKLSVILVGNHPASTIYTQRKGEMALSLGMDHETIRFPEDVEPEEVYRKIMQLNSDPSVDGILIQRPLPKQFQESQVLYWITPEKDVDAFHPLNAGRLFLNLPALQPCTPAGIMELLKYYDIPVAGKIACIIGRSSIVGKPMASLLLQANATVIQCHSRTAELAQLTQQADLLIVAAGKMELIDDSYIKEDSVIIDVGIHRKPNGKITGDVLFEQVEKKAASITPVPGGVGPMTIAILMQNTMSAAEMSNSR